MMLSKLVAISVVGALWAVQPVWAELFNDDLVFNGKFDSDLTGWAGSNVDTGNLDDQYALDGQFITLGQVGSVQSISQTYTVPSDAGKVSLSYFYRLYTSDTANDYLWVTFTRTDTNEIILSDQILASDGNVVNWTKHTFDASRIAGKTVTMTIAMVNNSTAFTFVDVDTIRLKAQSYGELVGTVKGESGTKLRNADITIRTPNNTKIWTGTTNAHGKFTAELLPGKTEKYKVIIKKSGETLSGRAIVSWAKRTTKTFTIENL